MLLSVRDSQDRLIDERTVTVNAWSSAEWTLTLPAEGTLGNYSVRAILESDKPKSRKSPRSCARATSPGRVPTMRWPYEKAVRASFLVAAYRRPDFRVDVTLTSASAKAGDPVKAVVSARYLFGAAMPARPATWTLTRSPASAAPAAVHDALPDGDRWEFVGSVERDAGPVGR